MCACGFRVRIGTLGSGIQDSLYGPSIHTDVKQGPAPRQMNRDLCPVDLERRTLEADLSSIPVEHDHPIAQNIVTDEPIHLDSELLADLAQTRGVVGRHVGRLPDLEGSARAITAS